MSIHSASQPLADIHSGTVRLIAESYPRFLEMIQVVVQANRSHQKPVPLLESLEHCNDDPILLYSCLWYAYCNGVNVMFLPREEKVSSAAEKTNPQSAPETVPQ